MNPRWLLYLVWILLAATMFYVKPLNPEWILNITGLTVIVSLGAIAGWQIRSRQRPPKPNSTSEKENGTGL
jgi:hypothetical protein